MSRSSKAVAALMACCALFAGLAAGCGSKGKSSDESSGGTGALKVGPGITQRQITLGMLTDLSGIFAPLAKPAVAATQLYWKQRNSAGGVCGRKVKLVIKDHGYDPQKAVVQYRDLSPRVAALQQLLGSPITAALLPTLKSDSMLSLLAAWPSSLLPNKNVIIVGTTYDIEMINGLAYLLEHGKIAKGDKIGHVYFEGEYGENGLKGSKAFAKHNGLTIVEQKIKATDEDMSGQVAALRRARVKAIAVTTAPTQLASVAGIAAGQGLNVPIVANNPAYDPALLKTPAAKAVVAATYVVQPIAPYNLQTPGAKTAARAFESKYPRETKKTFVQFGWAQAELMQQILAKACENKDLTRQGLVNAARQLSDVDLHGLTPQPLDYTHVGEPSARADYVARPANVPGGLRSVGTFAADEAKSYDVAAR